MAYPDISSPAPLATNKRKHLPDAEDEGGRKLKMLKNGGMKEREPRRALRIVTDFEVKSPTLDDLLSSTDSDADSLFDEPSPRLSTPEVEEIRTILTPKTVSGPLPDPNDTSVIPARRTAPSILGLYFDPTILIPEALGDDIMWKCIRTFFQDGATNQVMLFERSSPPSSKDPSIITSGLGPSTALPSYLSDLISRLCDILRPLVPPETHDLLFSPSPASHSGPPRARQAIINLYWPGEGITPHVDLLDRYGDGIIGVSFGSGCAMQFAKVHSEEDASVPPNASSARERMDEQCALYLPKGSILVMTQEARYHWTHGIAKRSNDLVEESPCSDRNVLLDRNLRLSITFRWLLPGADIVGSSVAEGTR